MATRIFGVNPQGDFEDCIDTVGPTATSAIIALVIDLSASVVGAGGVARAPSKAEVIQALEIFEQKILKSTNLT